MERIKKVLTLPVSYILRRAKNAISKRTFRLKKVVLEKELKDDNKTFEEPYFPIGFFRGHMTGSQETVQKICDHKFDILGSGLIDMGKNLDWNKDNLGYDKDVKIPWELSRFHFLLTLIKAYETTKQEKYVTAARELIRDFILKNPAGIGVNWQCPMEAAIRACNFATAWFFLKNTSTFKDENFKRIFLTSIVEHGKYIYRHLEYGPGFNTNHLIADLTGLLFLGILFPEFKETRAWKAKAILGLEKEMERQVYKDGVDYEASIPYHRLVCELFGYSAVLCKANSVKLSDAFLEKLERMFEFAWYYTKPNGLAPQIGDNDDSRLFVFEDFFSWERRDHRHLFWLAANLFPLNKFFTQTNGKESKGFKESGVYIMRKNDFYCIADCGKNGQNKNGGHCHNDTLSFELSVSGEDFIIDPGTYVYSSSPTLRRKFRGTKMHNTVKIDNEEMNRFYEHFLFSVHNDAAIRVNNWQSNATRDHLDAQHYGYKRLKQSVIHRRTFDFDKQKLVLKISDFFITTGQHNYEWNFHFAQGVILRHLNSAQDRQTGNTTIVAEKNNVKLYMLIPHELAKYAQISEGEVSPRYGIKEKAQVLTINLTTHLPKEKVFEFLFSCNS